MGFGTMLGVLQKREKGYIILANAGEFYLARGKDALCLHELLGLKLNCFETEICKVGFPINSLEKYTKRLEKASYSYIVFHYDKNFHRLELLKKYTGKYKNSITEDRGNCYICTNTVKMYRKTDKYMQALIEFYEKEGEEKKLKNEE